MIDEYKLKVIKQKFDELTEANDHTGAMVWIAANICRTHDNEDAERQVLSQLFSAIMAYQTLHTYFGHVSDSLRDIRSQLTNELFTQAECKGLGDEILMMIGGDLYIKMLEDRDHS